MRKLWLLSVLVMCGMMLSAADDSLLAHLKFNAGEGDIAKDFSGHGNSAKLINVKWEKYGVEGRGVRLNGKDSYIDFGNKKVFDFTQDFTLSLWFKVETFARKGRSLWVRGNYARGWQTYIYKSFLAFSSIPAKAKGGVYRCRFASGTSVSAPFVQVVITGKKIDDNKTEINYYINGKPGKMFFAGKLPIYSQLTIGRFASAEGQWFNGIIDEAKIYNRPLSAKEVKTDYQQTLKAGAASHTKVFSAAPLAKVKLPPLKKQRIAIFAPGPGFPDRKVVREIDWFEKELKKLGLRVTKLNAAKLGDAAVLNTKNFDTLILPVGSMPFEGEYSIYKFLKDGGRLITASCTPTTWKANAKTAKKYKFHTRGWFAPFLIRHLPFPWARRKADQKTGLNPAAAKEVGDLLPPIAGPYPNRRYCLVDRWDLQPATTGRMGDTDVVNGKNICLAADVMLPLYSRGNGEATSFHVYRYFNTHIFGGTLIELGATGSELLKSSDGAKVLRALLHFAENKLPGEQSADYYRRINKLHRDWSALGDIYIDTLAKLRDAAYFSYLTGSDKWHKFNTQLAAVDGDMRKLTSRKTAWNEILLAGNPAKIDSGCRKLDKQFSAAGKRFLALQRTADKALHNAFKTAKVPVKSPYGKLLVESYLTLPQNLYMLRTWNYPARKRIGVNMVNGRIHPWYVKDPVVKKQLKGFSQNLGIQYYFTSYMKPKSGSLNPVNGTIKDGPPQKYDYALAEKKLKDTIGLWQDQGFSPFRLGLADETGLGLKYWGSQARQDFQQYLAKQYDNNIAALNKHWGTKYASFKEIKLPVKKPETSAEHAAWEHWRTLREKKFEAYTKLFYDTVKKYGPKIAVSNIVSTGSLESPLYGVNFYNVTKNQDISGIDGTGVNPPKEWLYLDLTKKRVLTPEWGGLYTASSLDYINGKLWEELTGGALGFDFWCWQFADSPTNYVNFAGLPTLYGSRARGTVIDAKKIEHVIMDGHRVKPEVGILFSQTSRVHDQSWGSHGNKTISPHVQAVINYYGQFLKFHRSARVVPEEKLLEGNVNYLKMLIVPQAVFLSKAVQQKLLEYVRQGGTLALEGRVGQFDNFGKPSNMLFRAAQVVPGNTAASNVRIGRDACPVAADDTIFAPASLSGNSRALAEFGSSPAVLEKPLGKGKIIFIGFSAGLKRYANFQRLLDTIWRADRFAPRFIVSNDNVLLREWKLGNDTYLLLTSRTKKPETFPLEIKVRGKCRIEDYLFGRMVKTSFVDGYTVFKTLMANGGRVFRIPGGAPSSVTANVKFASSSGQQTTERDDEKTIKLPFRGKIYAATALKWHGYTFRNSTIASGIDQRQGATYIIISKGNEKQKKRIRVGVDYYFRMRGAIFKVRSSNNFYKFPFHSDVTIEKVERIPVGSGSSVKKKNNTITLSNGLMQLCVDTARGGVINEIAPVDDQVNQVASRGYLSACSENIGKVPGPFVKQPFTARIVKNSPDKIVVELFNAKPILDKTLRKTITMRRGVAGFEYDLRCFNLDADTKSPPFELRWHPELAIGGLSDNADIFIIPTPKGIRRSSYTPSNSGFSCKPGGDWAAVVDYAEQLAYVTTFRKAQVRLVYVWQDATFYDLEIFSVKRQVKKGDSIDLNLGIYLLRGLTGLDVYRNGFGAQVVMPDNFDQRQPIKFAVNIASAYEQIQPLKMALELRKENKLTTNFGGKITDAIAYDQPVKRFLTADLSKCPDGLYQLKADIQIAGHPNLSIVKDLRLSGTQRANLLRYYNAYCEKLKLLSRSRLPALQAGLFDLRVSLEEFRGQITAGRLNEAAASRKSLVNAIAKLEKLSGN